MVSVAISDLDVTLAACLSFLDYKTGSKATVLRFSDDFAKSKSKNVEERSKSDERRKVNNLVTSLDEWNKTKKTVLLK